MIFHTKKKKLKGEKKDKNLTFTYEEAETLEEAIEVFSASCSKREGKKKRKCHTRKEIKRTPKRNKRQKPSFVCSTLQ
jgi:hypothetical protein